MLKMRIDTAHIDRANVCAGDSVRSYVTQNRPALLEGFITSWPAFRKWSLEYFAQEYGEVVVEFMAGLRQNLRYERRETDQSQRALMREFVRAIERNPNGGDIYLVAQNHALKREEMQPLVRDLVLDGKVLDPHDAFSQMSLWIGPGGTVTPLHYDLEDALLAQVSGTKRVLMISPEDSRWLYNQQGGYSEVDPENPNLETFPLFTNARVSALELEAGSALFIPARWWHHVRALSPSVSLSMGNLVL